MMTWFDVGCWGLFSMNLFAFLKFSARTSPEAYELVYTVNAVMHFLWGIHNLHMAMRYFNKTDEGTESELRRGFPMLFYSILGACGSGFSRNFHALMFGPRESIIQATWGWEWFSLLVVLCDLGYFLLYEKGRNQKKIA